MNKTISSFSSSLLNNYDGLKSFLSGESAILYLKNNADKIQLPSKDSLYYGRWQVVWILSKYPFEWMLSLFFSAISKLFYYSGISCASKFFYVLSEQMTRDHQQYECYTNYKNRLLVPAFNDPQLSAYDVYTQSPFPIDSINDSKVKKITADNYYFNKAIKEGIHLLFGNLIYYGLKEKGTSTTSEKKEMTKVFKDLVLKEGLAAGMTMLEKKYSDPKIIKILASVYHHIKEYDSLRIETHNSVSFFSPRGVCRGATTWFIYLYLKTKYLFQDPKKHLIALAELFHSGVPSQGCFLQDFLNAEENILDLKLEKVKQSSVSLFEMDVHERSKMIKKLQNLSQGIYFFGVRFHAFSYIKISKTEGYIWNPNSGLIELTSANQAEELLDDIINYHYKKEDTASQIEITQVSLQSHEATHLETA